jgi:hypothetical protein
MTDLDEHIRRRLDRVPAPDSWPAIQDRVSTATPRRRPPRRSLVGAGALATVLAVVLVVTVVVRDDGRHQQELQVGGQEVPTSTTAALPPPSGPRIVSSVTVDVGVGPMTAGFGSVWVGSSLHQTLVRIDPATNKTLATISLGTVPSGLAVGEGAVWAVGWHSDAASPRSGPLAGEAFLIRIDPLTNTVSARLPLEGAYGVAVGPGAIWVASAREHLWRVDPVRMQVTARIAIDRPHGVAATADAVWVTSGRVEDMVERVDPSRNVVTASIATGSSGATVAGVSIGTQLVWIGSGGDGTVTGIDPATNTVRTTLRVGGRSFQSLADDGAGTLWVASSPIPASPSSPNPTSPSTILRVDVATGKSSPPLDVGPQVAGVAFFDGALWVADRSQGSVLKIQ